jgi:hypothetical protein
MFIVFLIRHQLIMQAVVENFTPDASYIFALSDVGVNSKYHRAVEDLEIPPRVLANEFHLRELRDPALSQRQIRLLYNLTGQPTGLDQ